MAPGPLCLKLRQIAPLNPPFPARPTGNPANNPIQKAAPHPPAGREVLRRRQAALQQAALQYFWREAYPLPGR